MNFYTLREAAVAIVRTIDKSTGADKPGLVNRWEDELMQGFLRGELRVCSSIGGVPIRAGTTGAIVGALTTGGVSLAELNRWLGFIGSGAEVTEETTSAMTKLPRIAAGSQVVRDAAARMANEWANEHFKNTGEIPAEEVVSKAIRSKLNEAFEKDWSDKTIRRHALMEWRFSVISPTARSAQAIDL